MDILKAAIKDTKILKEAALETAKNSLIEAISPEIEKKVAEHLGEDLALEMPDMCETENTEEEEKEEMDYDDKDMEGDDSVDEVIEAKSEDELDADVETEEEEEEAVEETINITQEDLKAALAEVLNSDLSEADVSKGFADVEDPNDVEGPGERGIEDKEKEQMWKDNEPPAATDWSVKESVYKKEIARLRKENSDYRKANTHLHKAVQEVNLFNSKLLHTSKLLNQTSLTTEQRASVIDHIDRAENMREVEIVYKSLSESFKIAGVIKESGKNSSKKARGSGYVPASSTVLKESVEREQSDAAERWKILAGIVK